MFSQVILTRLYKFFYREYLQGLVMVHSMTGPVQIFVDNLGRHFRTVFGVRLVHKPLADARSDHTGVIQPLPIVVFLEKGEIQCGSFGVFVSHFTCVIRIYVSTAMPTLYSSDGTDIQKQDRRGSSRHHCRRCCRLARAAAEACRLAARTEDWRNRELYELLDDGVSLQRHSGRTRPVS